MFKFKFFEISCKVTGRTAPGTRTMVTHEHIKQIGRCRLDNLCYVNYNRPTVQAMCLAPLAANLSIMDINNRLSQTTEWNASTFNHNCPFVRGLGLDMHEDGLVSPDDEFPNIYSELRQAFEATAAGRNAKVVTREIEVYVYSSISDQNQFIEYIRKMYRSVSERIISVSKVSINHSKRSLRDAGMGDTLELLTMRLRQRTCYICHDDTDDAESDRRIICLPCSHLYHEDCIMLWLTEISSCPLCGYQLFFKEVECELPCDWPRRHRRNGPNLFKTLE